MQYHPKLKIAMAEINAILERHDIAGLIILHTPEFSEFNLKINPSYSCAFWEGESHMRLRSLLKEYGGDKAAQHKKLTDTVNMMKHLTDNSIMYTQFLIDTMDMVERYVEIELGNEGNRTSHNQQNN